MSQNFGFVFTSKLKKLSRIFLLKCLHFLNNTIELWLNFHLNKNNKKEMSLQNISQPLSHDQINKIVEGVTILLPGVLENVLYGTKTTSSHDEFTRHKLYIGSLGIHTTSETLRQIFSAYGEIKDAFVVRDKFGMIKEYDL